MSNTKATLRELLAVLQAVLIERDEAARAMLLALLAGEHVLLIGPPGAAKSQLARRLSGIVQHAVYFERLLTKFSVPEELFGPLSIKALEQDRFERKTQGFLPEAHIAFIDEVFKASSAILNTLLLLLNERVFDNGDRRHAVPLMTVVAASNEVPQDETLAAFYDRFALRVQVAPVSDAAFTALLTLQDAHPQLPSDKAWTPEQGTALLARASAVRVSDEALALLTRMREFTHQAHWSVSDRRWRKLVHLMQVAAVANDRDAVSAWDCLIAPLVLPMAPEEAHKLTQWLAEQLGVWQAYDAPRFTKVIEAFEATLEQEMNARDVVTTDTSAGKMQFAGNKRNDSEVTPDSMRLDSGFLRQRLYGPEHIGTRVAQVRELQQQLTDYQAAIAKRRVELQSLTHEMFVLPAFVPQALAVIESSKAAIAHLQARSEQLIEGYKALPRMPAAADTEAAQKAA